MNFMEFRDPTATKTPEPKLKPLKNTYDLALVVTAGAIISGKMIAVMPEGLQQEGVDQVVAMVKKYIDEYIEQQYGKPYPAGKYQ